MNHEDTLSMMIQMVVTLVSQAVFLFNLRGVEDNCYAAEIFEC